MTEFFYLQSGCHKKGKYDEFCFFTILFLKMKCFKFLVLRDDKIVLPEKFSCCLCLQQLVDNFNDNHMLKYTNPFKVFQT